MSVKERLLRHPTVYAAWQAPFADAKFAPIRSVNDLALVRDVLDVGCGPGTSRRNFRSASYIGVDINPSYLRHSRSRAEGCFVAADVAHLPLAPSARFDFILVNSLLHHLPTDVVHGLLGDLAELLAPGGAIHVLDLVLPRSPSLARWLARMDRGEHARLEEEWVRIVGSHFTIDHVRSYRIGIPRLALWNMIYVRGITRG
jgi:SAM-dependent methyltransferase